MESDPGTILTVSNVKIKTNDYPDKPNNFKGPSAPVCLSIAEPASLSPEVESGFCQMGARSPTQVAPIVLGILAVGTLLE